MSLEEILICLFIPSVKSYLYFKWENQLLYIALYKDKGSLPKKRRNSGKVPNLRFSGRFRVFGILFNINSFSCWEFQVNKLIPPHVSPFFFKVFYNTRVEVFMDRKQHNPHLGNTRLKRVFNLPHIKITQVSS